MISAKFFAASFFSATLSTRTIFALSVGVLSSTLLTTAPWINLTPQLLTATHTLSDLAQLTLRTCWNKFPLTWRKEPRESTVVCVSLWYRCLALLCLTKEGISFLQQTRAGVLKPSVNHCTEGLSRHVVRDLLVLRAPAGNIHRATCHKGKKYDFLLYFSYFLFLFVCHL